VTFNVVKLMFIAFLKFHVCYHNGVQCLSESYRRAACDELSFIM